MSTTLRPMSAPSGLVPQPMLQMPQAVQSMQLVPVGSTGGVHNNPARWSQAMPASRSPRSSLHQHMNAPGPAGNVHQRNDGERHRLVQNGSHSTTHVGSVDTLTSGLSPTSPRGKPNAESISTATGSPVSLIETPNNNFQVAQNTPNNTMLNESLDTSKQDFGVTGISEAPSDQISVAKATSTLGGRSDVGFYDCPNAESCGAIRYALVPDQRDSLPTNPARTPSGRSSSLRPIAPHKHAEATRSTRLMSPRGREAPSQGTEASTEKQGEGKQKVVIWDPKPIPSQALVSKSPAQVRPAAPAVLSARQRKQVYNHSTVLDATGASEESVYCPSRVEAIKASLRRVMDANAQDTEPCGTATSLPSDRWAAAGPVPGKHRPRRALSAMSASDTNLRRLETTGIGPVPNGVCRTGSQSALEHTPRKHSNLWDASGRPVRSVKSVASLSSEVSPGTWRDIQSQHKRGSEDHPLAMPDKAGVVKNWASTLVLPSPSDMKATIFAGHDAVLPSSPRELNNDGEAGEGKAKGTGLRSSGRRSCSVDTWKMGAADEPRDVVRARLNDGAIPRDFWGTSSELHFLDHRPQSHGPTTPRAQLDPATLKGRELGSSVLRGSKTHEYRERRNKDLRPEGMLDIHATDTRLDPGMRGSPRAGVQSAKEQKASQLYVSADNTLAVTLGADSPTSPRQAGSKTLSGRADEDPRRRTERNFSDMFTSSPRNVTRERSDSAAERADAEALLPIAFDDPRGEIYRRRINRRWSAPIETQLARESRNRTLSTEQKQQTLEDAACRHTRSGFEIGAEVGRRQMMVKYGGANAENDNKAMSASQRKRSSLASGQVRQCTGAPSAGWDDGRAAPEPLQPPPLRRMSRSPDRLSQCGRARSGSARERYIDGVLTTSVY
mmetsp:Transcript_118432/g.334841  ORF Transcript_118432/g.334841 Transcript_118432/m.334841 type:complete len:895 (-) Transcript_118432:159-2843(-)